MLLNTVVFLIGKGCALTAGKEHRALRSPPFQSQFTFVHNNSGGYVIRCPEDIGTKLNKGGLKHRKVEPKVVDIYSIQDQNYCPVRIITKYFQLLPTNRKTKAFYLQPREKFHPGYWFFDKPVGENKLREVVKELCKTAGLPGYYTNHSLRSISTISMYQGNVDEQIIQEITGHCILAVRSYKRTCDSQRKLTSNIICGMPK